MSIGGVSSVNNNSFGVGLKAVVAREDTQFDLGISKQVGDIGTASKKSTGVGAFTEHSQAVAGVSSSVASVPLEAEPTKDEGYTLILGDVLNEYFALLEIYLKMEDAGDKWEKVDLVKLAIEGKGGDRFGEYKTQAEREVRLAELLSQSEIKVKPMD